MSSLRKDRELVRKAAVRLIVEREQFNQHTTWLRECFDRHRPWILVGGGFGAGLLLGRKQFVQAARSILSITSLGFGLMKSSLGSMLVAATLRKTPRKRRKLAAAPEELQG